MRIQKPYGDTGPIVWNDTDTSHMEGSNDEREADEVPW